MEKTLVYHLYVMDNCRENFVYEIHKSCLRRFIHNFDKVKFYISVNDLTNVDHTMFGYEFINSLGFNKPMQINVVKNNEYGEAVTFKEEIVDENTDGMVFFAHSKGVTHFYDKRFSQSIFYWILTLYYYNFTYINDVEKNFINLPFVQSLFMGALMCTSEKFDKAMPPCFMGTFFWVNMPKYKNCKKMNLLPEIKMDGRWYAESYCGYLANAVNDVTVMESFNNHILCFEGDFNAYYASIKEWEEVFNNIGDVEGIKTFINEISTEIGWVCND